MVTPERRKYNREYMRGYMRQRRNTVSPLTETQLAALGRTSDYDDIGDPPKCVFFRDRAGWMVGNAKAKPIAGPFSHLMQAWSAARDMGLIEEMKLMELPREQETGK